MFLPLPKGEGWGEGERDSLAQRLRFYLNRYSARAEQLSRAARGESRFSNHSSVWRRC